MNFKVLITTAAVLFSTSSLADALTDAQKKGIAKRYEELEALAKDPILQKSVKERNLKTPDELKDMTQDKWKSASMLDKAVRGLSKNETAEVLKAAQKKDPAMAEAFLSAADGTKIAFLSKTSNWSHKGKGKHDKPMAGERWQGDIEVDESSGVKQIQISVPVLVDGKPAGSLVGGYQLLKL